MQSRMTTDLALQALLSAAWRRKPKHKVMINSDQGPQFTNKEWQSFLGKHNLAASISRRGNCHPSHTCKHVLAGSGQRRGRELLSTPKTRTDQAVDIPHTRRCKAGCVPFSRMLRIRCQAADDIEMFFNPTRKHTNNGMLSPDDYAIKRVETE